MAYEHPFGARELMTGERNWTKTLGRYESGAWRQENALALGCKDRIEMLLTPFFLFQIERWHLWWQHQVLISLQRIIDA
jgi:hypothetical protein